MYNYSWAVKVTFYLFQYNLYCVLMCLHHSCSVLLISLYIVHTKNISCVLRSIGYVNPFFCTLTVPSWNIWEAYSVIVCILFLYRGTNFYFVDIFYVFLWVFQTAFLSSSLHCQIYCKQNSFLFPWQFRSAFNCVFVVFVNLTMPVTFCSSPLFIMWQLWGMSCPCLGSNPRSSSPQHSHCANHLLIPVTKSH